MNNRIKRYRILLKSLLIICYFIISFSEITYGYYDNLSPNNPESLSLGEWLDMNATASYDNVGLIINKMFNQAIQEDLLKINYINSILLDQSTQTVDEVFIDYSYNEIKKTIEMINENINSFLYFNNGVLSYPASAPAPLNLGIDTVLPSQSICLSQVLLTADLLQYEPVILTVSMSSNTDISDFIVEVLIDRNAFQLNNPFSYTYKHTGMNKAVSVISNKVILSTLTTASFYAEVRTPAVINYQHSINTPQFSGDYCRFPTGPSGYLTAPAAFTFSKNATVEGIFLRGTADGSASSLIIELNNRISRFNSSVTVIPIKIVVSRASNSLINTSNTMPLLTINVTG